ncbi:MAG: hypothetical protein AAFO07_01935 [Bacteroidota bacterium]
MGTLTQEKLQIRTLVKRHLADTVTAVSLFLKVRDHFTSPVLLESNDFASAENCFSFIGLDEIGSFMVENYKITQHLPGRTKIESKVEDENTVSDSLKAYLDAFDLDYPETFGGFNGLFGHVGFEAVQYFDTLSFDEKKRKTEIPDIRFSFYRYVIAINHYKDELFILENLLPGEESKLEKLENLIASQRIAQHKFQLVGEESSNLSDQEFMDLVTAGKKHCQLGDVFEIIPFKCLCILTGENDLKYIP